MHDRVQTGQRRVVAEHPSTQGRSVERAIGGDHLRTECVGDAREHLRTGALHVSDDLIGIDDHRPQLRKAGGDRRLARGDAAGERKEWHGSILTRAAPAPTSLITMETCRGARTTTEGSPS